MDTWDDAKLNQVVADKRTEANINLKTTIVCRGVGGVGATNE